MVILVITAMATTKSVRAADWNEPERLTFNSVEDRTTSGSLFQNCLGFACAVWMQEQEGPGWRIMSANREIPIGWSAPQAVDPGNHADYAPRIAAGGGLARAVWQRGTGSASEIVYAEESIGEWAVETVTSNNSEDLSPDLAVSDRHLVWVGFDQESGTGKIFHAEKVEGVWQIEVLAGSQLGGFWTGAAPKIDVSTNGDVHVVYRGGDFGNYHLHYARKHGGKWGYQVLTSGNANDFVVDVATSGTWVYVAMSGNDGFGFPSHIYLRWSEDGGSTFASPVLMSESFSAELANLVLGVEGAAVAGAEVSGNILTGNLFYASLTSGAEILPPADFESEGASAGQSLCIPLDPVGLETVLYTNRGGGGADSAEVYFLSSIYNTGVDPAAFPERVSWEVRVHPNPFSAVLRVEVEGGEQLPSGAWSASIYDVSGRLVRRLVPPSENRSGAPVLVWDGTTQHGNAAPAGVYLLRVQGSGSASVKRLVRIR
jgi:hypothetical protein